jgi:hypothetical protein
MERFFGAPDSASVFVREVCADAGLDRAPYAPMCAVLDGMLVMDKPARLGASKALAALLGRTLTLASARHDHARDLTLQV